MSDNVARRAPAEQLHALCEETAMLVGNLPGSVQRVAMRTGDYVVEVEWSPPDRAAHPGTAHVVGTSPTVTREPTPAGLPDATEMIEPVHEVRAPLVGTFYRSSQPGAPPFVSVGDVVEAGQTVAIVEAMKLMNSITADVAGRIAEIYVHDEEPVEFDQPLLRITPTMHVAPVDGQRVA